MSSNEINKNLTLKLVGKMKSNYEIPEAPEWMLDLAEITSSNPNILEVKTINGKTSIVTKAPGAVDVIAKIGDKQTTLHIVISTKEIGNYNSQLSRLMLDRFLIILPKGRLIEIKEY